MYTLESSRRKPRDLLWQPIRCEFELFVASARQFDSIASYFNFIEFEFEPVVELKEISESGMSSSSADQVFSDSKGVIHPLSTWECSSSGTSRHRIATAHDIRIARRKCRPKRYAIGVSRVNPLIAMAHGACRLVALTLPPPCPSSIRHHAGDP
jgi:hypothetical protein